MSLENTEHKRLVFTKYQDVKQELLTSLNASTALDNSLNDLFITLEKSRADVELSDDETYILKEMGLISIKISHLIENLYNEYKKMPYEDLVSDGRVHEYLRYGNITFLTEGIVELLSQELILLRKYSVATKETELIKS